MTEFTVREMATNSNQKPTSMEKAKIKLTSFQNMEEKLKI